MICIIVTEDEHGTGMQQLPVDEILYLQSCPNYISVHTENKIYYTAGALTFWEPAFKGRGLNFLSENKTLHYVLHEI